MHDESMLLLHKMYLKVLLLTCPQGLEKARENNATVGDGGVTRTKSYFLVGGTTPSSGTHHLPSKARTTIENIDFYVHAGDFIYEYGAYSKYATDSPEREANLRPQWETISLADYRQRFATYCEDEALQNVRRMAPMIATWDDHEFADNAFGNSFEVGANNHQEVCPVDFNASDDEKDEAHCDFDEGDAIACFQAAARAYLEWMPVRAGPGSMGPLGSDLGTITRVLEWGNLATFVTMDTRVSHRSKEPTLANVFAEFSPIATKYRNVSSYVDPSSPVRKAIDVVADKVKSKMKDPQYTMVGPDHVDLIRDAFLSSKLAKKPWQLLVSPTLMGPNVNINPNTLWKYAPVEYQNATKEKLDELLEAPVIGIPLRIFTALAITMTPWNRDDFNGFAHERAQILTIFEEFANNGIVLGGDLHDSWCWTLYDHGNHTGKPVAVNLGGPDINSPGFARSVLSHFGPIAVFLGDEVLRDMMEQAWVAENPGLVEAEVRHAGFVSVTVTHLEHVAEYIYVEAPNLLLDYPAARSKNVDGGGLTASYFCNGKLITNSSEPGSLVKARGPCDATKFLSERPHEWDIPVSLHSFSSSDVTSGAVRFGSSISCSCGGLYQTYGIMLLFYGALLFVKHCSI